MLNIYKLLITKIKSRDPIERRNAALALSTLGPGLLSPLMALMDEGRHFYYHNDDPRTPSDIAYAIGMAFHPEAAVASLIKIIETNSKSLVRKEAACTLRLIGPVASNAVPSLISLLNDKEDFKTRRDAALALGSIGNLPESTISNLKKLLDAGEAEVRIAALRSFGMIKCSDNQVVLALTAKATNDPDPRVRLHAAASLGAIYNDAAEITQILLQKLHSDDDDDIRLESAIALQLIPPGQDAMPLLSNSLIYDKSHDVRRAVAFVIRKVASPESPAISHLLVALQDADILVRLAAAEAIRHIKPASPDIVPVLLESMSGNEDQLCELLMQALQRMGTTAAAAGPSLLLKLQNSNPAIRIRAAIALISVTPDDPTAVEELVKLLEDDYAEVRLIVASILSGINSASSIAIKSIIQLIGHDEQWVQQEATDILQAIGTSAMPALIESIHINKTTKNGKTNTPRTSSIVFKQFQWSRIIIDDTIGKEIYLRTTEEIYPRLFQPRNETPGIETEYRMTSGGLEQGVAKAKMAFESHVERLMAEREGEAVRLQPILNNYLNAWADYNKSLRAAPQSRSAEEIAQAKYDLAQEVSGQLDTLGISIFYKDQPVSLMSHAEGKNRYGYFVLRPINSSTALIKRSELKDLLTDAGVGSGENLGFKLALSPPRREGWAEWRDRARQQGEQRRI